MRTQKIAVTVLSLLVSTPLYAKMEVHEWGTFTSLVGSNGLTQSGMYHEDEKLPDFVVPFGTTQADLPPLILPFPTFPTEPGCHNMKMCFDPEMFENNFISQKMETPVIYFYGDPATADRRVTVDVKFPKGIITETFPAPVSSFPKPGEFTFMQDGHTVFDVTVGTDTLDKFPHEGSDNIYYHARNTQSLTVRHKNQVEKFIFYRGLGQFQPKVEITSQSGGVNFKTTQENKPSAAFLVNVSAQNVSDAIVLNTAAMTSPTGLEISSASIHALKAGSPNRLPIRDLLVDALQNAGMFEDESVAMVNTWENGYLKTPGLRVLYILPRAEVDQILPLTLTPAADVLERAFVARIEIMTDLEELGILKDILNTPNIEMFPIHGLGRFAEAKLRRVREVYAQNGVASLETKAALDKLVELSMQPGAEVGVN